MSESDRQGAGGSRPFLLPRGHLTPPARLRPVRQPHRTSFGPSKVPWSLPPRGLSTRSSLHLEGRLDGFYLSFFWVA